MKKKTIKRLYITAIILSIIASIIIIGGHFNILSISGRQIHSTTTKLISDNYDNAVYEFSFISEPQGQYQCETTDFEHFILQVTSTQSDLNLPDYIENLKLDTFFNTTEVQINGIGAIAQPCSDLRRNVPIILNNTYAECKIYRNGLYKSRIDCIFYGDVYPMENGVNVGASIYGLTDGTATIKFPKTRYCPIGQMQCPDGICKDSCSECPNGQVKCDDGICRDSCDTCQDGLTLCSDGSCKDSCEEPNYLIIIIVAFIIIFLIILLGYLYIKTKGKR